MAGSSVESFSLVYFFLLEFLFSLIFPFFFFLEVIGPAAVTVSYNAPCQSQNNNLSGVVTFST